MTDQNQNANAGDTGGQQNQNQPPANQQQNANQNNTATPPETGEKSVPKTRLDAEIAKRRGLEDTLKSVVDGMIQDVPEQFRELIPALAPADQIKWINDAKAKGLFVENAAPATDENGNGPDANRPGGNPPKNFEGMNPVSIMETGYSNR
ncbi:hypothetical protein K8I31_05260 [bacterium]|nr:hypothetical protein [bacterium]